MDEQLYENYLAHYGVIGMKWGVRRGRRIGDRASANAKRAKQYRAQGNVKKSTRLSTRAKKQEAHSKRIMNKHNRLAGKKAVEKTENESWGKTLVKAAVMGSYGALNYNKARVARGGRAASAAIGLVSGYVNNKMTLGMMSIIEPRTTARAVERATNPKPKKSKAYKNAKAEYKSAKKQYRKDFNKANNRSIGAWSPKKEHRENAQKRWAQALDSADKMREAKDKYKKEKIKYKVSRKR